MQAKSALPPTWNVPQLFRDRVGEQAGRQRAMFADGHLLLILHAPPSDDHSERGARFFWRSPDGTWLSNSLGSGPRSLRRHVDEFLAQTESLEKLEDEADRSHEYDALLSRITPLLRTARHLHATLQEARELVREDRDLIVCRDLSYAAERAAELLQSDVQNGLQCAVAKRAEEQAESSHKMAVASHRLNLLAAFFLPLATIASVFGMNLPTGFAEKYAPWHFWATVGIGIVFGFLLGAWMQQALKRRDDRRGDRPRNP
jgi:hypothetical protein